MEFNNNNWNSQQNYSGGSYSSQDGYMYGQNQNNERKAKKGITFGQLLATVLVVCVLSCGLTAFLMQHLNQRNELTETPVPAADQNSLTVVEPEVTPTPAPAATPEEAGQNALQPTPPASDRLHSASGTLPAVQDHSAVIQSSMSSVVGIYISNTAMDRTGQPTQQDAGSGSGVILTEDGYVVTNNHVVAGGQNIRVCLQDGTEYEATLIGTDAVTDLAVIKIDGVSGLPAATLGSSASAIVGEPVFAIGNPLGVLTSSVSQGIISGLDRSITVDNYSMSLMQTDAAVNPGNSGGGLFNAKGELIGIVNAKSYGLDVEGIGFAIPMDSAKPVIMDLIDLGYVTGRPYIGITMQDVSLRYGGNTPSNNYFDPFSFFQNNYSYMTCVQVLSVQEGSAAEQAGIQVNDLLVAMNDKEITSSTQLSAMLYEYEVGDTVTISVLRGNETIELSLTLGERAS